MKDLLVKQAVKSMTRGSESQPKDNPQKNHHQHHHHSREKPLTAEEHRVLKKVKSRAHLYDKGLSCCCFKVGLDGIIGLIPVIGDFVGVFLALMLVRTAMQLDLPKHIVSRMMMNIAIDFAIGLVPVAGDLLDIMYKCNTKNAELLEDYLKKG
ncbi:hypothetical protein BY458DRAFT_524715 [Sporodiniella umbellata]|nr:hypothetical protein BY458DRAFT_524715 [Sporodiniella umbellata]